MKMTLHTHQPPKLNFLHKEPQIIIKDNNNENNLEDDNDNDDNNNTTSKQLGCDLIVIRLVIIFVGHLSP